MFPLFPLELHDGNVNQDMHTCIWRTHHLPVPCNGQLNEPIETLGSEQERIIAAPYNYLLGFPGKDIRGKLISAFNADLKVPEAKLETIKEVIELLHTASLLVDDIEDSSILRRGFPVAHSIFGIPQTINCANFIYFKAQSKLVGLQQPQAFEVFTEELLRLHHGQGMDLHWRDSLTCPTEDEYLGMVSNKTGGLFRLAIKLMQIESNSEKHYVPLADILGILFQIRDDYQNLKSDTYTENKGFGEDITEGKLSFPIIHSIMKNPGDHQLANILRQRTQDQAVKAYAVQIINSTGSFEYSREKIKELTGQARSFIEDVSSIDGSKGLWEILDLFEVGE